MKLCKLIGHATMAAILSAPAFISAQGLNVAEINGRASSQPGGSQILVRTNVDVALGGRGHLATAIAASDATSRGPVAGLGNNTVFNGGRG